jgi:hypothetical protein
VAAQFNAEAMNQASKMKTLKKELSNKDPSVTDLGKFDPENFDAHENAFLTLLAQSYGVLCEPLHYVVRPDTAPADFNTTEERRMYRFPLSGNSFELDNQVVFCS